MFGLSTKEEPDKIVANAEVIWQPIDEPTVPPPAHNPTPVRPSMKWFYFCANFRYPLGALLSTFSVFFTLAALDLNELSFAWLFVVVSTLLLLLAVWACELVAALWLRNLRPIAYKAAIAFVMLFPVQYQCTAVVYQGVATSVFIFIAYSLCLTLPELIYFSKRRCLFYPGSPITKKYRVDAAKWLGVSVALFTVLISTYYFAVEKPNSQKLWTIGEDVLYHQYDCHYITTATEMLYYASTIRELEDSGYFPCRICNPH